MDRRDFYFKQPVTESELNGAFDAVEQSIWALMSDNGLTGIAAGMVGAQASPTPNLTVSISGPGYAYDAAGERIFLSSPTTLVDLTLDSNGVPTSVTTGNERYLSVYIKFARTQSDPRIDGASNSIFFVSDESFEIIVVQGTSNSVGSASRPTIDPTQGLLLFDVHRTASQSQIFNADILTDRRQDTFNIVQTPVSIQAGTLRTGLTAILTALNNHITGVGGASHPDTGITSAAASGSPLALPGGSVRDQLLALQTEVNTVAALAAELKGSVKLAGFQNYGSTSTGTVTDWASVTAPPSVWTPLVSLPSSGAMTFALPTVPGGFQFGDFIEIELRAVATTVSANAYLSLGGGGGTYASADMLLTAPGPIFLKSIVSASSPVQILGQSVSGPGSANIVLSGGWSLSIKLWRPTP